MEETLIEGLLMMLDKDPFEEYLKEPEPDKFNKSYAWSTAIGLQAVDRLKPSEYLIDTAIQNIEGKITIQEAQNLIDSYYAEKPQHLNYERTEEADKVSARIAGILSEAAFSFSPNEYISIHRRLFQGIYKHAGRIRDYNITKKEVGFSDKTIRHIQKMFDEFGLEEFFGRSAVADLLGLQNSSVSKLLSKLLGAGIIEPVSGHGKGKYRFSTTII